MTSSDSAGAEFVCNICGRKNGTDRAVFGRETASCDGCGSTVRTRGIVHMISRELFGADLVLPDFPVMKGIRGIGMSDSADYAERLADKFDYRNTHYHKAPEFNVVDVPEHEWGRYDFLIASEVFEHVAPPVERAFQNAFRLLKPHGVFFFTVPYTLDSHTVEHFPDLHEHGIAQVGDRLVLVNRTREGQLQVFEDLVFHGGAGSTLEIRRFAERELREQFLEAGFRAVEIYSDSYAPFGVCHSETWSLPMTARKEPLSLQRECVAELIAQWVDLQKAVESVTGRLNARDAEYREHVAWADRRIAEAEGELTQRTDWARNLETQLQERTEWALSLEKDLRHHVDLAKRFQSESVERTAWALNLEDELQRLRARLVRITASRWTRAGRAVGFVKE